MEYILQQIDPGNSNLIIIILDKNEVIVGRKTVVSLSNHRLVSRKHASFHKIRNSWYIKDLGSLNNLYVNAFKIVSGVQKLDIGDTIGFGIPYVSLSGGFVCVLQTRQTCVKQEILDSVALKPSITEQTKNSEHEKTLNVYNSEDASKDILPLQTSTIQDYKNCIPSILKDPILIQEKQSNKVVGTNNRTKKSKQKNVCNVYDSGGVSKDILPLQTLGIRDSKSLIPSLSKDLIPIQEKQLNALVKPVNLHNDLVSHDELFVKSLLSYNCDTECGGSSCTNLFSNGFGTLSDIYNMLLQFEDNIKNSRNLNRQVIQAKVNPFYALPIKSIKYQTNKAPASQFNCLDKSVINNSILPIISSYRSLVKSHSLKNSVLATKMVTFNNKSSDAVHSALNDALELKKKQIEAHTLNNYDVNKETSSSIELNSFNNESSEDVHSVLNDVVELKKEQVEAHTLNNYDINKETSSSIELNAPTFNNKSPDEVHSVLDDAPELKTKQVEAHTLNTYDINKETSSNIELNSPTFNIKSSDEVYSVLNDAAELRKEQVKSHTLNNYNVNKEVSSNIELSSLLNSSNDYINKSKVKFIIDVKSHIKSKTRLKDNLSSLQPANKNFDLLHSDAYHLKKCFVRLQRCDYINKFLKQKFQSSEDHQFNNKNVSCLLKECYVSLQRCDSKDFNLPLDVTIFHRSPYKKDLPKKKIRLKKSSSNNRKRKQKSRRESNSKYKLNENKGHLEICPWSPNNSCNILKLPTVGTTDKQSLSKSCLKTSKNALRKNSFPIFPKSLKKSLKRTNQKTSKNSSNIKDLDLFQCNFILSASAFQTIDLEKNETYKQGESFCISKTFDSNISFSKQNIDSRENTTNVLKDKENMSSTVNHSEHVTDPSPSDNSLQNSTHLKNVALKIKRKYPIPRRSHQFTSRMGFLLEMSQIKPKPVAKKVKPNWQSILRKYISNTKTVENVQNRHPSYKVFKSPVFDSNIIRTDAFTREMHDKSEVFVINRHEVVRNALAQKSYNVAKDESIRQQDLTHGRISTSNNITIIELDSDGDSCTSPISLDIANEKLFNSKRTCTKNNTTISSIIELDSDGEGCTSPISLDIANEKPFNSGRTCTNNNTAISSIIELDSDGESCTSPISLDTVNKKPFNSKIVENEEAINTNVAVVEPFIHQLNKTIAQKPFEFLNKYTSLSCIQKIVEWNPKWLYEEQENNLFPIVANRFAHSALSFNSYDDYFYAFSSISVLDIWQSMLKEEFKYISSKIMNCKEFYCIVKSCTEKHGMMELQCCAYMKENLSHNPLEGTIVLMDIRDAERDVNRQVFGYVFKFKIDEIIESYNKQEHKTIPNAKLWTFNIYIKNQITPETQTVLFARSICNIQDRIRILDALCTFQYSPLKNIVLQPNEDNFFLCESTSEMCPAEFIKNVKDEIMDSRLPPKIFLLHGAPGTGKTHSILVMLDKLLFCNTFKIKILVCAPSHSAVDEIGLRLVELNERRNWKSTSLKFVRIGNSEKVHSKMHPYVLDKMVAKMCKKYCRKDLHKENELKRLETDINALYQDIGTTPSFPKLNQFQALSEQYRFLKQQYEEELDQVSQNPMCVCSEDSCSHLSCSLHATCMQYRATILGESDVILSTLGDCVRSVVSLMSTQNAAAPFTCCIVDGAAQCSELELLQCMTLGIEKVFLVGDIMSSALKKDKNSSNQYGYSRSMFERFYTSFNKFHIENPVYTLIEQHRMHSEICSFPSAYFYNKTLLTSKETDERYKLFPLKPYVVLDVLEDQYKVSCDDITDCDQLVLTYLCTLIKQTVPATNVGIIAAENKVPVYDVCLTHNPLCREIEIKTEDSFHSIEKDVIIIPCVQPTVESNEFLNCESAMKVALTRARQTLIIYGHLSSLSNLNHWKSLIEDAKNRNLYTSVSSLMHIPLILNEVIMKSLEIQEQIFID